MLCPKCGAEYREGFDRCSDCEVDQVHEAPAVEVTHEAPDYVTVFSASEPDIIPVIKSLLEGAGIPFLTSGEAMMNLFPSMLGPLLNGSRGEIRFSVPEDRAEEARRLLAEGAGIQSV